MPRRPHRYVMTPLTVLFDNRLSPTARMVYSVLVYFAYPGTVCIAMAKEIAESLDITTRTLARAIAELEQFSYIARPADAAKRGSFAVELIAQKTNDSEANHLPDVSDKNVRHVGQKCPTGPRDVGQKCPTQVATIGQILPTCRTEMSDPILLEKKEINKSSPLPPKGAAGSAGSDDSSADNEPFISTPDEWPPQLAPRPEPEVELDHRGRPIIDAPPLPGREHWPPIRNDREMVKAAAAWAEQAFPMIGIDAQVLRAGGVAARPEYWVADIVAALAETRRYGANRPWNYCCSILNKWMREAQGHPTHGVTPTRDDFRRLIEGEDEPKPKYYDSENDDFA